MNSFRNVMRAIEHEVDRQIELVENGQTVAGETRMFDANTGGTYSLRSKETLNDYRYFPEPDLQPVVIDDAWLARVRDAMPALPRELHERFKQQYGLSEYDAGVLVDQKEVALYFDALCQATGNYKAASNWVMGPVKSILNERAISLSEFGVGPQAIAEIITLIDGGKISFSQAREKLLPALVTEPNVRPADLAQRLNLLMSEDNDALSSAIAAALAKYPDKVLEYKNGKKGVAGLFMGEIMKATGGKANPKQANEMLAKALEG